jgi:hypothetical protein
MWFLSGETPCRRCEQPLDLADDFVTVSVYERPSRDRAGFYHRACYGELPDRQELTARWAENLIAAVRGRLEASRILRSTPRFLAEFNSASEELILYFLQERAEARFRRAEDWAELTDFLTGDDLDRALLRYEENALNSRRGRWRLALPAGKTVVGLAWSVPVARQIEFARAAYEAHRSRRGPLKGVVDFAALAAEQGLEPVAANGNLPRCKGLVTKITPGTDTYQVSYTAERVVSVELARTDCTDLGKFVRGVG